MAYNEQLADRIRFALLPHTLHIQEKKMMGGLTFMLHGKMCCGIVKDDLMVRVVPSKFESALKLPHCRVMDFTGRPMKGFVFVGEQGFQTDDALKSWLDLGVEFVENKSIVK